MRPLAATPDASKLAKPLAPEDVCAGVFVAVLDEEFEWPAAYWYCDPPITAPDVIRVRLRPRDVSGPLRVVDACLPFVFVKNLKGAGQTLDLRAVRIARVDAVYARRVWRELRRKPKGKTAKRGK